MEEPNFINETDKVQIFPTSIKTTFWLKDYLHSIILIQNVCLNSEATINHQTIIYTYRLQLTVY